MLLQIQCGGMEQEHIKSAPITVSAHAWPATFGVYCQHETWSGAASRGSDKASCWLKIGSCGMMLQSKQMTQADSLRSMQQSLRAELQP